MAKPLEETEGRPRAKAEIRARVLGLAGPALVEMFLVSFVSMADMMMVGRVGPAAVTSVGLTNQPMMFFQAVFMALNVGTTALVARSIGAGDHRLTNEAARQTLIFTTILGLLMSAVAYLGAGWVMRFMGAEQDVIEIGVPYFQAMGLGLIFNTLSMAAAAALRGAGDTKSPMTVNITSNVLNLIGCYTLIYGHFGAPALGVLGAGISTTLSRAVGTVLFLYLMFSGGRGIHIGLRDKYRIDWSIMRRIFAVGFPTGIEQVILRGGQVTFARVVAGLGTVGFAAHQIGMNILSLSFMPGQAFAIGATTLVGQNLGARDPRGAEKCAAEARRIGLLVAGSMAVMLFFFGRYLAWMYTNDATVMASTALVLKIYALCQPAQSTAFILAGALRGAGDTKWPLYATAGGVWFLRVALAALFINVFDWGLVGAWLGMAGDQLGRTAVISSRFKSGRWKLARV